MSLSAKNSDRAQSAQSTLCTAGAGTNSMESLSNVQSSNVLVYYKTPEINVSGLGSHHLFISVRESYYIQAHTSSLETYSHNQNFFQSSITGPSSSSTMRYYEARYPEVDELVMVQVRQIAEMGAYVKLVRPSLQTRPPGTSVTMCKLTQYI
jgi:hypothetical protein